MAAQPPIILVHGATSSASIWTFWLRELARSGWPAYAIDLRGHGGSDSIDLSGVSMHDYAADVAGLAGQLGRKPVLVGWSMGGLVALMVAASGLAEACVGLAPSRPARRIDPSIALRRGEFGPEEYGITDRDPDRQRAMPDLDHDERLIALGSLGRESRLARDERQRGIIVETLPCPLLLVTGSRDRQWPRERYDGLWLATDELTADEASHWGLVLNRRALGSTIPAVLEWIQSVTSGSPIAGR